jgi:hypothetical protein
VRREGTKKGREREKEKGGGGERACYKCVSIFFL